MDETAPKTFYAMIDFVRTVYLAGPMRGYPRCNFDRFAEVAASLRSRGLTVVSPHEHDLNKGIDPDTFDPNDPIPADCLKWDMIQAADCDMIVFLDGWEKSQGAIFEATVGLMFGRLMATEHGRTLFAPEVVKAVRDWWQDR